MVQQTAAERGIDSLLTRIRDVRAAAGGGTPVVLIDGPSGAGKSTLAARLVRCWPGADIPRVVHLDDMYPGWNGLDEASMSLAAYLLEPLARSGRGRWRRWDWAAGQPARWHEVSGLAPLIVEGCGTLAAGNVRWAHLALWLDADDAIRKQRALERDGETFASHWEQWQATFDHYVVREEPRTNADLVLDITEWPRSRRRDYGGAMTETAHVNREYIVEYADGPLAGIAERRYVVDGRVDERIGAVAAIEGLESLFWYVAGEERVVGGERYVLYHFDAPDSDPVKTDKDEESL